MLRALFSVRMIAVVCAASLWLVDCGQAEAAMMQYTLTSQATITGTLGGTAFTDKTFSITETGDTSNIVFDTYYVSADTIRTYSSPGTVSITIDGVGTATFSSPSDMRVTSEDVYHPIYGHLVSGAGFTDYAGGGVPSGGVGASTGTTFYDLSSPFSASSSGSMGSATYHTSSGDLVISSSVSGTLTFTAETAAAVPEPSSLALGAVGAGLALLAVRRRRS